MHFHAYGAPHQDGQIDPSRLAELLASKGPPGIEREMSEVRVYRGQPDSQRDPKGYAANDRQCSHWRTLPKATVITRTLRYPHDWPREKEQEKGIDIQLAIDLVAGAVRRQYDVALLMSTDTDLKPALEFVRALQGDPYPRCEVASGRSVPWGGWYTSMTRSEWGSTGRCWAWNRRWTRRRYPSASAGC